MGFSKGLAPCRFQWSKVLLSLVTSTKKTLSFNLLMTLLLLKKKKKWIIQQQHVIWMPDTTIFKSFNLLKVPWSVLETEWVHRPKLPNFFLETVVLTITIAISHYLTTITMSIDLLVWKVKILLKKPIVLIQFVSRTQMTTTIIVIPMLKTITHI